jgi:hypothetical protein
MRCERKKSELGNGAEDEYDGGDGEELDLVVAYIRVLLYLPISSTFKTCGASHSPPLL